MFVILKKVKYSVNVCVNQVRLMVFFALKFGGSPILYYLCTHN